MTIADTRALNRRWAQAHAVVNRKPKFGNVMVVYGSNIDLDTAAEVIGGSRRIAVVTHAKPDGDAMGAVMAMTAALVQLDHEVMPWIVPPVSDGLRSLHGAERVCEFKGGTTFGEMDLLIVLDTGALSQLGAVGDQVRAHLHHAMVIDHHLSGDLDAKWQYIDPQASACCEILVSLLDAMGVSLDDRLICEPQYHLLLLKSLVALKRINP